MREGGSLQHIKERRNLTQVEEDAGRNIGTKSYKYEFGNFAQLYVVDISAGLLSGSRMARVVTRT
jgi:hypothetical protein